MSNHSLNLAKSGLGSCCTWSSSSFKLTVKFYTFRRPFANEKRCIRWQNFNLTHSPAIGQNYPGRQSLLCPQGVSKVRTYTRTITCGGTIHVLSSKLTNTPSAGLVDTPAFASVSLPTAVNLKIFTAAPTTRPTSSSPRNLPGQKRGPCPNPK